MCWKPLLLSKKLLLKAIARIPFLTLPWPMFKCNHRSALEDEEFVTSAIKEQTGCVVPSEQCPIVYSPLSVVARKLRLVLDLRYVNQFIPEQKLVQRLKLGSTKLMFNKGDYCFTFDLKSGYHHVDIHPNFRTYLGFSWCIGKERLFYMFRVLPFGLSSACYVFTKLLRPLVKRWRGKGIRAIVYIDDGIVASKSQEQCRMDEQFITSDLELAGFVLNIPKSQLEPHQLGGWLSFIIDLCKGDFRVSKGK